MRRWPSHIYAASSDWWPRAATRARRRRSRASSCRGSDLVNVTLIFSLRRYAEVAESYVRGLERLVAAGGDPRKVASVASFFVSRIDTEADRRAGANATLAYQHYKRVFRGSRWEYLASKGATPQRVLWASTSTKNPAYPDTLYVDELIGPDTVNTMPEETIKAYQAHG